ncbi:peptidylprolyl isomerase [Lentibacter sp. XHP0401]|uniref:peptidylprolyl isomerase n=1 Tax=Lentibacter sp. XHP0401 TaxID=2984334 RepID=UPI0021E73C51|nr:peptidylprolyl isomerase [Lentibacter sp. XHP0401]MCV2891721.1 peptidylprolyl isomerase [Lentibacter sp. XHP0401]
MITFSPLKTLTFALVAQAALAFTSAVPAYAQNLFAPVIKVNDKVITEYELGQRARMLQLFRSPGDPATEARKQLIEERLKLDAAESLGLSPTPEELAEGMAEFAGRANMDTEQFLRALEGGGVDEATFRDFIITGIAWRTLVRAKFGPRVEVDDNDIDRALSATSVGNVRVLLSEIILPAPPPQAAQAQARAQQISQITTESAFASAARQYSATASRNRGGRLDWMPLSNLPPALHGIILGLAPGQVTDPIPIDGGIALFQMRGIEEGKVIAPEYSAIEYAAYYIAGGRTPEALANAKKVKNRIDTCDDLYGIAKGQPVEVLERGSKAPADIPTDIAIELAKLDKHEVSTALTRSNGQTLVFLMLCGRTTKIAEEVDRGQVGISVQNRRLSSFADGYLAQLRDEARIIEY